MSKARDLANAGTALGAVTATELGYVDGVTSAIQTQIDAKEATLPSQTGNSGKYLTTNGTAKSWGTVSQYALPTQTGNSGKYLTTNGTAESWATVNQPLTWNQRIGGLVNNLYTAAYNGSDMYVAAGGSGLLYSSPDGVTWTSRTTQFSGVSDIYRVAYGNGLWVAVGESGRLSTSTDGITWTTRTSNMSTNNIVDVVYDNSIWVAVGNGGGTTNTGGIIYSTNGTTWTRKSQSISVGSTYSTVIWNGTNWIIGSTNSGTGNNYLYATAPSGTWTADIDGQGDQIWKIIWDGTRHTYHTNGGWWYSTSTSTLTGGAQIYGAGNPTNGAASSRSVISYRNGIIYQGYLYYNSFAPTSTGVVTSTPLNFSPTAILAAAGGLSGSLQGVIAVSAGLIMLGDQKIFTSF